MLGEDPPNNVKLRQAGSGFRRLWDVELVIKEGHMYLCRGWEKFYRAYDLRHGYFLLFRYDADATMLIVKVFNVTMCRMRYADDDDPSTFCLFFFLYIWLCLASIVNGHCCIWTGNVSKDSKEDDPDWSGEEEEQSGHQAEDDLAMVVVPDNDLAPVVAPAIPLLGDTTTPIVVEDYIPLPPPPRRSWRIRLRKEKKKNNVN